MNFELTIRGDSFAEIAAIFNRGEDVSRAEPGPKYEDFIAPQPPARSFTAKEVGVEEEGPKPTRTKKPKAEKEAPAEEPKGSTEKVTFEDLRAAASPLMEAGKSRDIQEMLVAKFDVRAFGALKEEQYADCLAELQSL